MEKVVYCAASRNLIQGGYNGREEHRLSLTSLITKRNIQPRKATQLEKTRSCQAMRKSLLIAGISPSPRDLPPFPASYNTAVIIIPASLKVQRPGPRKQQAVASGRIAAPPIGLSNQSAQSHVRTVTIADSHYFSFLLFGIRL